MCDFHPGYTVEPVMPGMDAGTPLETVPVDFWQFPPEIILLFLAASISSVTGFPVELFLILKLYAYLGYRKISRANLLHNESRNRVLSCIQENPGIGYNNLMQITKINRGTLRYHLKILSLIRRISVDSGSGNYRYYVNSGTYSGLEKATLKYLRNKTDGHILRLLLETSDLTRYDFKQQLGLSASTVSWRMKRLSDEKIIRIRKSGKNVCYQITPECQQILKKHLLHHTDLQQSIPDGDVSENG
jgi:predicted transcriptional regulator